MDMVAPDYACPGQHEWADPMKIIRGTKEDFWVAAWHFDFGRRKWFINHPEPEMRQVESTGPIRNFAYTEEWTGRMVRPFICFTPKKGN